MRLGAIYFAGSLVGDALIVADGFRHQLDGLGLLGAVVVAEALWLTRSRAVEEPTSEAVRSVLEFDPDDWLQEPPAWWERQAVGVALSDAKAGSVVKVALGPTFLHVKDSGGIQFTDDGGESWSALGAMA